MANISYVHAHGHAVVLFVGELDWEASHTLVSSIEEVLDHYFYTEVELVVVSPGGSIRAFEYYLNAFRDWRNKGIRFRTRVISNASSAAAVIVSLGDERVAEPGAKLMYHHARVSNATDITASATAGLHAALRAVDERLVGYLADRVLADPVDTPKVPFEAERSDREVLERLHAGLETRDRKKTPAKHRRLARAVGRSVDRAFRDCDRDALQQIYRRLFEIETPISARLARTPAPHRSDRIPDRRELSLGRAARSDDPGVARPLSTLGRSPPRGAVPSHLGAR